jgi:hypothetical protein
MMAWAQEGHWLPANDKYSGIILFYHFPRMAKSAQNERRSSAC